MIAILTGCSPERATALADRLLRGNVATFDPQKGEGIQLVGGSVIRNHGCPLVVRDSSGRVRGRINPGQAAAVPPSPRKLRRIGGSDRLWRALRGGR